MSWPTAAIIPMDNPYCSCELTRARPARTLSPPIELRCGHPTTWTILQKDDPYHLGLRYNVLPVHQMALITSGCAPFRSQRVKDTQLVGFQWPLARVLSFC